MEDIDGKLIGSISVPKSISDAPSVQWVGENLPDFNLGYVGVSLFMVSVSTTIVHEVYHPYYQPVGKRLLNP